MVAAAGLAALPLGGIVLGMAVTGVYTPRYVLPAAAGLIVLAVQVSYRRSRGCPILGSCLLVGCILLAVTGVVRDYRRQGREAAGIGQLCAGLERDHLGKLPVAVSNPLLYLQLVHCASPALADRLVYLSDVADSVRYLHQDTAERALRALRCWTRLHVVDYAAFLTTHRQFFLLDAGAGAWLATALTADGAHLDAPPPGRDAPLFLVHSPRPVRIHRAPEPP
jgi:hypothetical protein